MRVGGPAEFFTKISTIEDLSAVVRWARSESLPYLLLGGGSNILVSDTGVRGLVIQNRCRSIEVTRLSDGESQHDENHDPIGWDDQYEQSAGGSQNEDQIGKRNTNQAASQSVLDISPSEVQNGGIVFAESGAAMAGVARSSIRQNLTGLEWAVSVPGTIGGAIVNNAGAHGGEIKDNLAEAMIVDEDGNQRLLGIAELDYEYRSSSLKSQARPYRAGFGPVVLWGKFYLDEALGTTVNQRADEYLSHRRRTQPVEPSLGSMFMNPPNDFAGRLIEDAGLKSTKVGGIQVSKQHANFIINPGGVGSGKAADVVALIQLIQERVEAQFGVQLKPEVQLVGEWE